MKLIVSLTVGSDDNFIWSRLDAYRPVPFYDAQAICDELNRSRFRITGGERWRVVSVKQFEFADSSAPFQSLGLRKDGAVEICSADPRSVRGEAARI